MSESKYSNWYTPEIKNTNSDIVSSSIKPFDTSIDSKGLAESLAQSPLSSKLGSKQVGNLGIDQNTNTPWYRDNNMLSGLASVGSLALQLASYSDMKKHAQLTNQSLQHNLNEARADSALKAERKDNLNTVYTRKA